MNIELDQKKGESQSCGLFVVGTARSGTTLLNDIFNTSPDICIMGESNLCFHWEKKGFSDWFNQMHRESGISPRRTVYLHPFANNSADGSEVFSELSRSYRFVGEKTAFGPHDVRWNDMNHQDCCFDFYGFHFQKAYYFLIIREPVETVWSMYKKFGGRPIESLLSCWFESFRFLIRTYYCFPRVWVVFHDRLDQNHLDRIEGILGTKFRYDSKWIRPNTHRQSFLESGQIPEPLSDWRGPLKSLHALFQLLEANFSKVDFGYCGELSPGEFLQEMLTPEIRRVELLLRDAGVPIE